MHPKITLRDRQTQFINQCFCINQTKTFLAATISNQNEEHVILVSLLDNQLKKSFKSPTQDLQSILFINHDNALLLLDGIVNHFLFFMSLNGSVLRRVDLTKSSIDRVVLSADSTLSVITDLDNSLELFNNKNFLSLARLTLAQIIEHTDANLFFQEEVDETNQIIGRKIRKFAPNLKLKAAFTKALKPEIGKFTLVRFSADCNFLAMVSSLFPSLLFILDLKTESIVSCVKFEGSVSNLFWKSDNTLIVLCANHIVYFWTKRSIFVSEKYYQKQARFSGFEVSEDDECLVFRDNQKVCIFSGDDWGNLVQ